MNFDQGVVFKNLSHFEMGFGNWVLIIFRIPRYQMVGRMGLLDMEVLVGDVKVVVVWPKIVMGRKAQIPHEF